MSKFIAHQEPEKVMDFQMHGIIFHAYVGGFCCLLSPSLYLIFHQSCVFGIKSHYQSQGSAHSSNGNRHERPRRTSYAPTQHVHVRTEHGQRQKQKHDPRTPQPRIPHPQQPVRFPPSTAPITSSLHLQLPSFCYHRESFNINSIST